MALKAIACFKAQTYPYLELIILDDAREPSFSGQARLNLPSKTLYAQHTSRDIAEKRNVCARMAGGKLICHWDSDDWSAPDRVADQVERLESGGKAVTGYHSMLFVDEQRHEAYWYSNDVNYAIGTSLLYTKNWWRLHPFMAPKDHPKWGEDNAFKEQARLENELTTAEARALLVARIHPDNTCPKSINVDSCSYRPVAWSTIPEDALCKPAA
jgi:glycosyltransferase involved in cell wall biosynthesis